MTVEEMVKIWFHFWAKPTRKAAFKDREALEKLGISEAQYRWLLIQYQKYAPYPTLSGFIDFAEGELREDVVPEHLVCVAYLSNKKHLIEMANDLESLIVAFFPNQKTHDEAEKLRKKLHEALFTTAYGGKV